MANTIKAGVRSDRQTDGQTVLQGIAQTNKIRHLETKASKQPSRYPERDCLVGKYKKSDMEAGKQTKRQSYGKIDK